MTAEDGFNAETVRAHLAFVGLAVPEEDIEPLVIGARRTRAMAEGIRRLVADTDEPASVFAPKAVRR